MHTASAYVPEGVVYPGQPQAVNTVFVSLVDQNVSVTPYNLSMINNHTVAGPTWLVWIFPSSDRLLTLFSCDHRYFAS